MTNRIYPSSLSTGADFTEECGSGKHICNRLPVPKLAPPHDSPPLFSATIVHQFSWYCTPFQLQWYIVVISLCHLFHVFIPLHFHRFRIKSFVQTHHTASLQQIRAVTLNLKVSDLILSNATIQRFS